MVIVPQPAIFRAVFIALRSGSPVVSLNLFFGNPFITFSAFASSSLSIDTGFADLDKSPITSE